jgi:hypothetical protein
LKRQKAKAKARTKARTKATAGPSTAQVAKSATCSAQDDSFFGQAQDDSFVGNSG